MLSDETIEDLIRVRLHHSVDGLLPGADLVDVVRRRYRRRQLQRGGAFGGSLLALAAAVTLGIVATQHSLPTMQLAGYTVTLPAGSVVSSPLGPCTKVAVQLNVPAHSGVPAASSSDAITSPSGNGCISGLLTWVYGTGTAPTPDPIVPTGAQSVTIGSHPASEITYADGFTFYVQLPAPGGGYQDLVVGSIGLSQQEVTGLVQQAITEHLKGTTTG
jgi:hypothetical protein